ncbi:hypothetical protein C8R46DRAFT_1056678 [Mycena filopes]|nr:hypothetical protein C8R46DRAFT_1056678 [Mycena filopes]
MQFTFTSLLTLVLASISATLVGAQSCTYQGHTGVCEYTSSCHAPAYYHVANHCPGPTNYQCCLPSGCVVCAAAEEQEARAVGGVHDLKARIPCC